jgi:enoyl-CoA hydratase
MVHKEISCQTDNGVAVVNINAAPRNGEELLFLMEAMAEAFADIAADNGANVVIVAGGQGAFDMGTILASSCVAEVRGAGCHSLAASIARLDCPVIAAIQGAVAGQGLELALACDIRIAASGSSFCLPQLTAGMIPHDGGTQRLPRIVGKAKALEMILMGQLIDDKEADRIGLVSRLVSPAELMTVAMEAARKMALQAPLAVRYAKEAICQGMEMNIQQGLRLEADLYFLLHTTSDRREGIEAFQEKRTPKFTGQ